MTRWREVCGRMASGNRALPNPLQTPRVPAFSKPGRPSLSTAPLAPSRRPPRSWLLCAPGAETERKPSSAFTCRVSSRCGLTGFQARVPAPPKPPHTPTPPPHRALWPSRQEGEEQVGLSSGADAGGTCLRASWSHKSLDQVLRPGGPRRSGNSFVLRAETGLRASREAQREGSAQRSCPGRSSSS